MAEMEGDYPKESKGGMVRRGRRARGGRGGGKEVQEYNAQGSEAVKAADDESDDFNKGGRAKRRHGGHTEGHEARGRADRERRGRAAGGAAPPPTALKRGGHAEEEREEREKEREHRAAGGPVPLKRGGHAEEREHEREEHERERDAAGGRTGRASGGATPAPTRLARGGGAHSPFSSGRMLSPPKTGDAASRGMEGQKVGPEMD